MSAITIEGLSHRLGGDRELMVDHLEVGIGERLVLFGPNGAGKSTLLRLIAGTLPGGPNVPSAYLPQRPVLFRGRAAWNLDLGLDEEQRDRARSLAAEFGVADLLERNARTLSGGERQRLALARALARSEPVVLLDEPLAPLDAQDRLAMARHIVAAIGERTAVIVTHDRDEAALLGQRIAVVVDGQILQVGDVNQVLSAPGDSRVAAAAGVGNVVRGEVIQIDGPLAALKAGPLVVWGVGPAPVGAPATALFGAETVTVFGGVAADAGSARNKWVGTVVEVRPVGRLVEMVVECGVRVAALLTPGSIEALQSVVGDEVTLAVKATAVGVVEG